MSGRARRRELSAPLIPRRHVSSNPYPYRDVAVALADGYVRDPSDACETPYHMGIVENLGVMGIHYFRPDLRSWPPRPIGHACLARGVVER